MTTMNMSLPRAQTVRGYEIRRLPLGKYLEALTAMREAPQRVLQACFPGEDAAGMLAALRRIDTPALSALLLRAMQVVPQEAVRLLSALTGVPEAALLEDEAIGLDGAAEMLEAFLRLNDIANFTQAAARIAAQIRLLRAQTGSSGSSARG